MWALRIEYLTQRAVATAYNDYEQAEWPPHPARVFSALVATWAENDRPEDEERALRWLEKQEFPSISASSAAIRDVAPVYVPVNDLTVLKDISRQIRTVDECAAHLAALKTDGADEKVLKKARAATKKAEKTLKAAAQKAIAVPSSTGAGPTARARNMLPSSRLRHPRTFPSVRPEDPVVHFIWNNEPPSEIREALDHLSRRLVRLGHSSSLVACRVVDRAPEPTWVPHPDGQQVLRWVQPNQLSRLDDAFDIHKQLAQRVLPARFGRYRKRTGNHATEVPRPAMSTDWIVFRRLSGPRLPPWRATDVAAALRGALMAHADQPPRPILSGHAPQGGPAQTPHVAYVPLPWVGREHSDGRILGVALILPRDITDEDRRHVLRAVGRWERAQQSEAPGEPGVPLMLGRSGVLRVERIRTVDPGYNLAPRAWCGPARSWVSATPVALDRNPGDLRSRDPQKVARAYAEAEATIRRACLRVGLPEPTAVTVEHRPPIHGAAPVKRYPPFPRSPGKLRRVQVHVRIHFHNTVHGPLLLGAGRYAGLGLFRPLREEQ